MSRWINRSAFVVRPRQPFVEWRERLDGGGDEQSTEKEVSIYLVREDETGQEETPPLKEYYQRIFEAQLEAWCAEPGEWPQDRSLRVFEEWFEVVGESIVIDLEDSEIEVEEL